MSCHPRGGPGGRTLAVTTADAVATRALGVALGRLLRPGAVVLLQGILGAGKTTLAQGIAAGLGVVEAVNSPTFVLVREYLVPPSNARDAGSGAGGTAASRPPPSAAGARRPGRLVHMDFYRLSGAAEALDLGLDDYFSGDDVTVIEWPEHAGGALPGEALVIALAPVADGTRKVTLEARGPVADAAVAALEREVGAGRDAVPDPRA